jgi:hypothetical protein
VIPYTFIPVNYYIDLDGGVVAAGVAAGGVVGVVVGAVDLLVSSLFITRWFFLIASFNFPKR